MLTNTLAHITISEGPAGLLLFAAGVVLGGIVTLAIRYGRTN